MRPVPETNILALASELFSRTSIIKLPLNVIPHAATSTTNSIESAGADLKIKNKRRGTMNIFCLQQIW